MSTDPILCKFVKHSSIPEWEAKGWRVLGDAPGHHAYWSVVMVKQDEETSREPVAAAPMPEPRFGMHGTTRKDYPIASGLLAYFPDACAYVAHVSKVGNDQHNPGKQMFWRRGASTDHADCMVRHQVEFDQVDTDGTLHAGKVAWRAMAQLQMLLEALEHGCTYAEYITRVQITER